MSDQLPQISDQTKWLGYSGLLPQLVIVLYASQDIDNVWIGKAAGFGYAALILSFLGGTWWGLGLKTTKAPSWVFLIAVAPSLLAFASYLPWIWGMEWPGPSLLALGTALLASPFVDRLLAKQTELPAGWLRLRFRLSTGLGILTIILGFF